MALNFLKTLASKFLRKEPAAAAKSAPAKKEARAPQPQRNDTRGRPSRDATAKPQGKGWAERPPRPGGRPHHDGAKRAPDGGPQRGHQKPRSEHPQRSPGQGAQQTQPQQAERRPQQPQQERTGGRGQPAPPPGGRSIARPGASHGRGGRSRGHGRAPDRNMNTPANGHRPGGAVEAQEMEKRRTEHAAWDIGQYQVPAAEGKRRFHDFDLPTEILHAVADLNFQYCTPIQSMSLEHALAGKNVAGRAQTGTGKTAAFLVAILTRYLRTPEARQRQGGTPRALVIAPTRELVIQICKDADALGKYCELRSLAVYGGMDYDRQKQELRDAPVDLLVATPGRLLDFVRSHVIDLSKVDTLVIDEADRMLDMGFIPDVRSIMSRLPQKDKRCTMLYSATLTDDVMRLASQWMEAPVRVEVESEQVPTETIKQIVYVVTAREKFTVLFNHIQQYPDSRILVFCNRRTTTEDVAHSLSRRGIKCETLSGDVNQNRRLRVLEDFREGKVRLVIATDVAGRGLHVDNIGFVINFDFPYEPEDYVHRIGRTGRAGQCGTAISFADEDESFTIPGIEKLIGEELKCTVLKNDDSLLTALPAPERGNRGGGNEPRPPRTHAPRDARTPAHAPETAAVKPAEPETPAPVAVVAAPAASAAPPAPPPATAPAAPPPERRTAPPAPQAQRPRPAEHHRRAPVTAKRPDHSPSRGEHPRGEQRHHGDRRRQEPPRPKNVHKLPPPGAKFSEEWVPGGGGQT